MKLQNLKIDLEYLIDRTSDPCYNQLEAGFRHSALTRKEIEERKDDCLKEVEGYLRNILEYIEKEGIE